jgi:hypothetical protein
LGNELKRTVDIDEGHNTFRIFPSHQEGKPFIYAKTVIWLPQEVEMKNKDGEVVKDRAGNPKTEIKNRPIFNSRVHGSTEKDIVEEYVTFAEKVFRDEIQDAEELDKRLKKLFDWKVGIKPKTTCIVYGKKIKYTNDGDIKSSEFGRLAVLTNSRLKVTNSFNVSENCFYPIPKVKSTILVFEPFINKDFKVKEITNLEIITQVFFSKKRKMINKAFKTLFKKPSLVAERINIDLNLRPNKISESEYYKITEYFEKEL